MNVAGSPTGAGIVYVEAENQTTSTKSEQARNAPTHEYSIYATANQGYYFKEWTATTNITLGNSSESSTTAKITASTGDGTSGTATAIFKPNIKITGASAEEIYTTFNPAEGSQAGKTCVAVFNVENAESIDDFVDPPTIGGDDSDKFVYQSMSYTTNKVTINFVYNGNKAMDRRSTRARRSRERSSRLQATLAHDTAKCTCPLRTGKCLKHRVSFGGTPPLSGWALLGADEYSGVEP
jgi:hypothetical protein